MIHKVYFNMSSSLKRTKFYFLTIAFFSFVIILVSYNWDISENIYRISNQFSQVRIDKIQSPDVRLIDRATESFLESRTRNHSTEHVRNESTRMKSEKENKNGKEKLNSTTLVHKTNESKSGNVGNKTTIEGVKDLQLKRNGSLIVSKNIEFDIDTRTAKNSSQNEETDRQSKLKEKVDQTINETTNSVNTAHNDNHKMISERVVQNTKSNETEYNFENFKMSKEKALQYKDKIQKLKQEQLSDDHNSPANLQRTETRTPRPKNNVIRNNSNDKGLVERNIKTFQRIKNRLKNLGLINGAFMMPHNNQGSNDYNMNSDVTSRPDVCVGCFEKKFRKIIDEPNLCDGDVELLFMVASTFSRKDSRNAIRKTWCGECNKSHSKIKLVFVFGNKHDETENKNLLDESKEFHDIIQMDFHDSYANLTYKTMSSLQWSKDYCQKAKYVMKTDDDMYVNTELLPLLLKAAPSEKFIGGMCWGPSSPHRDSNSKWYVSFVQYRHHLFPSMCSGTGYVMSRDVVSGILRQSPNVPYFYLEDVYVAICVKKLGLHPVLLNGFKNTRIDFDPCTYRNQIITAHELSADVLNYIWIESRACPKADLTPEMVYRPVPV